MHYAELKTHDIANGPGVRVSLFVSGCSHRCPGCFNSAAWDYAYGQPFTQETVETVLTALSPQYIRGLTLLGGEPFDPKNQEAVVGLLRAVKARYPEKSVWAFTGYLLDRDLLSGHVGDPDTVREYLSYLDVLVDGPFIESRKDLMLRFRGSDNQRLIDIPATLRAEKIIPWADWQGDGRGMK